jgi:hypothetical protein
MVLMGPSPLDLSKALSATLWLCGGSSTTLSSTRFFLFSFFFLLFFYFFGPLQWV